MEETSPHLYLHCVPSGRPLLDSAFTSGAVREVVEDWNCMEAGWACSTCCVGGAGGGADTSSARAEPGTPMVEMRPARAAAGSFSRNSAARVLACLSQVCVRMMCVSRGEQGGRDAGGTEEVVVGAQPQMMQLLTQTPASRSQPAVNTDSTERTVQVRVLCGDACVEPAFFASTTLSRQLEGGTAHPSCFLPFSPAD
eukprot:1149343-Pelagomonas_calceolata.AAC.8